MKDLAERGPERHLRDPHEGPQEGPQGGSRVAVWLSCPRYGHLSRNRWQRLSRFASVRCAAGTRSPRDLRRQLRHRVARQHRAPPRRRTSCSCTRTSRSRSSSRSRWTSSTTSRRRRSPIDYLRLPLHTLKVGSYGTHHALGLAKLHRARFLTASTSEVYGDPQVHPQPESYWGHVNPIGPRGVYDEAKRYAEALTMAYHRQQGVDTAIVRIFNTYGPRMRPHDGRAIPTFLRQALQDRPITVFGTGQQTRSFCYVSDLIDGIIRLAESGVHQPVNIGNPNEFTLLELAKAVIEVTGSRSEIVFEALPTDDPQVRQPDISLARELLGWEPTVELREGLRRTLEAAGVAALTGTHPADVETARHLRRPPVEELEPVADAPRTPSRRRRARLPLRARRRAAARGRPPQAPAGALVPAADGDAAPGVAGGLAAGAGLRRPAGGAGRRADGQGRPARRRVGLGGVAARGAADDRLRLPGHRAAVRALRPVRRALAAPGHRADRVLAVPGDGRLADLRRWSTTRTTRATTSSTARSSSRS